MLLRPKIRSMSKKEIFSRLLENPKNVGGLFSLLPSKSRYMTFNLFFVLQYSLPLI